MADLLERIKTVIAERYVIERELGRGSMATVVLAILLLSIPHEAESQGYSSSISGNYRIAANVVYLKSGLWEGKLDVYARTDSGGPYLTLIWIHGGSSDAGAKESTTPNVAS